MVHAETQEQWAVKIEIAELHEEKSEGLCKHVHAVETTTANTDQGPSDNSGNCLRKLSQAEGGKTT